MNHILQRSIIHNPIKYGQTTAMTQMNHHDLAKAYAVYQIDAPALEPKKPFFIGCCPLSQIATMADAWTWSLFATVITDRDAIRMTVLCICATEDEATTIQTTTATLANVYVNLHSTRIAAPSASHDNRSTIRDASTGETFPNAAALARSLGVSQSAVSKHLMTPHSTLRGRKFERMTP